MVNRNGLVAFRPATVSIRRIGLIRRHIGETARRRLILTRQSTHDTNKTRTVLIGTMCLHRLSHLAVAHNGGTAIITTEIVHHRRRRQFREVPLEVPIRLVKTVALSEMIPAAMKLMAVIT